ncbi:MAG: hypothetical protein NTY10_01960 [Candidatus Omnitrophica bacterium]|nr:hypothetical protein [Candidatus Omnitrophota bacterium]
MMSKVKRIWLVVFIVIIVGANVVFMAHKKPVPNGMAPEPKATLAMTNAEISAAISYGKNHKGDLLVDFEKPWTVSLGYGSGKGSATVFTPYHCLALMARTSVLDNSAVFARKTTRTFISNLSFTVMKMVLTATIKRHFCKTAWKLRFLKPFIRGTTWRASIRFPVSKSYLYRLAS